MHIIPNEAAEVRTSLSISGRGIRRLGLAVTGIALTLVLAACGGGGGGGGGYARPPGNVNMGVTISGQAGTYTTMAPGGSLDLTLRAGQTLNLDAGEPVTWNILIGGTAVTHGAQVYYAGVNINTTPLSESAVAVGTYAQFQLPASVPITLVATSTYDSFQVATIYLLIVN